MHFTNIISTIALFAVISSSSPLQKRAVTVSTDGSTQSLTPQISTSPSTINLNDVGGKADAAGAVLEVVNKVVKLVQGLVDKDIRRRQVFTQETVSALAVEFPAQNVVMSNVGYSISCTPTVVQRTSYKAKVGSNVSYDVLVFGSGCTFTLKGDGGFENWAYVIRSTCKANGKTLTC